MSNIVDNYLDGWKRIVDASGKSTRAQFWTFYLVNWVFDLVLVSILNRIPVVSRIISVLVFIAGLTICIRRLHDIGKSGWSLLWIFLPIIGWIILLIYWLQPSK